MPTLRDDPNLWPRFEALRRWARLSIDQSADGWLVTFTPRDGAEPIRAEGQEMLTAVAAMLDEAEVRVARMTPPAE